MVIEQRMSIEETRAALMPYLESHHSDVSAMSRDVVFRNMATGDEARGPEAVLAMLNFFYKVAFDADAETRNVVIGEGIGVVEGLFVGRHVGEFAGIRATGRDVRVPICVIYELRDGEIVEGRVYFETPALLAQLGAPTGQRRPAASFSGPGSLQDRGSRHVHTARPLNHALRQAAR